MISTTATFCAITWTESVHVKRGGKERNVTRTSMNAKRILRGARIWPTPTVKIPRDPTNVIVTLGIRRNKTNVKVCNKGKQLDYRKVCANISLKC